MCGCNLAGLAPGLCAGVLQRLEVRGLQLRSEDGRGVLQSQPGLRHGREHDVRRVCQAEPDSIRRFGPDRAILGFEPVRGGLCIRRMDGADRRPLHGQLHCEGRPVPRQCVPAFVQFRWPLIKAPSPRRRTSASSERRGRGVPGVWNITVSSSGGQRSARESLITS